MGFRKIGWWMLVWIMLVQVGHGQDQATAEQFMDLAEEVMKETLVLDQALDMYLQAVAADPSSVKANWFSGELYLKTIHKSNAEQYFQKVKELDPDYRFNIDYKIGFAQQLGFKFEEAIESYNQYKVRLAANPNVVTKDKNSLKEVERRIYECENGIAYRSDPTDFVIENAGESINSIWPDYAPVINGDESLLVFTTRRKEGNLNQDVFDDNRPYEDIFISKHVDGEWKSAQNIGEPVNTRYFDSNLALSADGTQLFIYVDKSGGDIYSSNLDEGGNWSYPEPLPEPINSSYDENSFSITADGQVAFFSSDRPGGYGGIDIYMCTKSKRNKWGKAINLGEKINTSSDDYSPFIDSDGKTLYFSSRGGAGMGGYDIFKSTYDSASGYWSDPENLGYPINTPDNDVFFISGPKTIYGYYASVKDDGFGYEDIYLIKYPDPETDPVPVSQPTVATRKTQPVRLELLVKDKINGDPLESRVVIREMVSRDTIPVQRMHSGNYGAIFSDSMETSYMVIVEREGYTFTDFRLTIPAADSVEQVIKRNIALQPLAKGTRVILRNVYFETNESRLLEESFDELDELAHMMKSNPRVELEISGHTDNVGGHDFNMDLSQRRAQSVVNYLLSKGITKNRLVARGYGETVPLASNDDEEEGREINRRVEFEVMN